MKKDENLRRVTVKQRFDQTIAMGDEKDSHKYGHSSILLTKLAFKL